MIPIWSKYKRNQKRRERIKELKSMTLLQRRLRRVQRNLWKHMMMDAFYKASVIPKIYNASDEPITISKPMRYSNVDQ